MFSEASSPHFRDLVPNNAVLERVSHGHIFTEGPVWNAKEGALYFVDIIGDTIWKWTPGVGKSVFLRPSGKANGMTYDRAGRLVVAGWTSRNVWRMDHDGVIVPLAKEYGGQKLNTPNDVVVRSDGNIYFTDATGGLVIVGMEVDDIQQYRTSPKAPRSAMASERCGPTRSWRVGLAPQGYSTPSVPTTAEHTGAPRAYASTAKATWL